MIAGLLERGVRPFQLKREAKRLREQRRLEPIRNMGLFKTVVEAALPALLAEPDDNPAMEAASKAFSAAINRWAEAGARGKAPRAEDFGLPPPTTQQVAERRYAQAFNEWATNGARGRQPQMADFGCQPARTAESVS
jgi:hypothetical protein